MSGSGSGLGSGGGWGGESPSCETLVIRTTLSSPKFDVVASLKERDVLEVEKQGQTGPVIVRTNLGQSAGSITSGHLLRLMQCMDEGHRYVAIVMRIEGGKVEIEVRPRPTT